MMMKMMMKSTLKILILTDIILGITSFIFFNTKITWNLQIGFISSALVVLASMLSYKRMITARIAHYDIAHDDDQDILNKLEDPYDLYSQAYEEESSEDKTLVDVVKEEKKKQKANRRTFTETLKDTKATFSFYRLGAYVILILGFLYLNRHGLLHIPSYMLALGIPLVIIVAILLSEKEIHSEYSIK